jgi:hypothetical protein
MLFAIWAALMSGFAALMAIVRTNPDEIRSNISKYLEWAGIHRIPDWLRSSRADQLVFRWSAIAIGILLFFGVLSATIYLITSPKPLVAMAPMPAPPTIISSVENIHLSNDQKKQLISSFVSLKSTVTSVAINRSSSTTNGLWTDIVEVFNRAGFGNNNSVQTGLQEPDNPGETGVMICVTNPSSPSSNDVLIKDTLKRIGIKSEFIPLSEAKYKGDITIFVGPPPL